MQTSDAYALEHLSDDAFWDLAFSRAFPSNQQSHYTPSHTHEIATSSYLVCDDAYALPLAALHEITAVPQYFTLLPSSPSWTMGLIAWHGHILATIDLYAFLKDQRRSATERSLLITHYQDHLLAFVATVGQTSTLATLPRDTYEVLDVANLFNRIIQSLEKRSSDER